MTLEDLLTMRNGFACYSGSNEIGNINSWIIEMTFEGDEVRLSMKDATGLGGATFGGRSKE